MFVPNAEDRAYLRRLHGYWRDRHDNPLVIYGRARSRSLGSRTLFFLLFCATALGGLILPWGGWLLAMIFSTGSSYSQLWNTLMPLAVYMFFGVMGSSLVVPYLSLVLFAHGCRDADQLTDLAVTSMSRDEIAFGAVWNGTKAFIILMIPPLIGLTLSAASIPIAYIVEEGLDNDAEILLAIIPVVLMFYIAATVTCAWTFLAVVRCWLCWRKKLVRLFFLPPMIASLWLGIPWMVGFACILGPAFFLLEVVNAANRHEEYVFIGTLNFALLVEIVLVALLSIRILRGAGFLAGEKYFRSLEPVELQEKSWLANEAACRVEAGLRRAANKELHARTGRSYFPFFSSLLGTGGFLLLIALAQTQLFEHFRDGEFLVIFITNLTIWPAMALAVYGFTQARQDRLAAIAGGLIPTIRRFALPFLLYSLIPTTLIIGFSLARSIFNIEEFIVVTLATLLGTISSQAVLLIICAAVLLRYRGALWVAILWWCLSLIFVLSLSMLVHGDSSNSDGLLFWAWVLLFIPGVTLNSIIGFRFWNWMQAIHDRHLRDHPKHAVLSILREDSVESVLEFDGDA
ncbi:hypothetical protein KQI84_01345 [bacterium]|nr:hypothetical protein [bacterium]